MCRIAIESLPWSSVTTIGRFTIASTSRIATWPSGMIGVPISAPNTPGLVIVNVPPLISSGESVLVRALSASSITARERPTQVLLLGAVDDRHHQPLGVVDGDGHAQVDVLLDQGRLALHLGVDPRPAADRVDRRAGDERDVREVDAVALLVLGLPLLAQVDDAGHVDLDHGGDVRRRVQRVAHVPRDHLADRVELVELLAGAGLRRAAGRPARAAGAAASRGCGRRRGAAGAARARAGRSAGTSCTSGAAGAGAAWAGARAR